MHVVDLSAPDKEAAAAILQACVTTGFFYGTPAPRLYQQFLAAECCTQVLTNAAVAKHGVPERIIEEHWLQNKAFFSLPNKDKLAILADSNNRCWHSTEVLRNMARDLLGLCL